MKKLHAYILLNLAIIAYQNIDAGPCQSKPQIPQTNRASYRHITPATQQAVTTQSNSSSSSLAQKSQVVRFQDLPLEIRRDIFGYLQPRKENCNLLQRAVMAASLTDVRTLLTCGFDPNATASSKYSHSFCLNTPLCESAEPFLGIESQITLRKKFIILKTLLHHGADINKPGTYKETPVFKAVNHNCILTLQTLITTGANLDAKDQWDNTPLDNARKTAMNHSYNVPLRKTMYEIAALLEQHGAPSSVPFEPMPTDEEMENQQARAQMERESRHLEMLSIFD